MTRCKKKCSFLKMQIHGLNLLLCPAKRSGPRGGVGRKMCSSRKAQSLTKKAGECLFRVCLDEIATLFVHTLTAMMTGHPISNLVLGLHEQIKMDSLSDFQLDFLCNFIGKGMANNLPTNKTTRMLQIYLKHVCGPQTYATLCGAESLRLCHFDTVRGHIRDDKSSGVLL